MLLYAPNWLFIAPGATLAAVGMVIVLWLFSGSRHIGRVEFDIHTMFFGMIFVLLGAQILSIGCFARVFSHSERFAPAERSSLAGLLRNVTLETGLMVGLILTLTGLVGDISVFRSWASGNFGEFSQMRGVIFWSMWLFLGVQTVFSSFFLSMLGISRGTYIGDYDRR